MSDGALDELVERFLEARERDPGLDPDAFAGRHPSVRKSLAAAIRRALEAESWLGLSAPELPARIGPYRVVAELGRGGMGVVYDVERDGARFALKLLPHAPLLGSRVVERFRREARALALLDHPCVVRVHDTGSEDGVPYMVMERVEGRPLAQLAGELDARAAVGVVRDLARALQASHDKGVLHRDVKPSNVLVRTDGTPVLVDFGLGAAEGEASLTSTGDVLGTPRYMAPEQAQGGATDARTDVYALGLVLYELLCGAPAREERSRERLLQTVASGRIPPPRRAGERIGGELERVLGAALAREPADRYPSAAALTRDLERWLAGEPVRSRPPGTLLRTARGIARHPRRAILLVAGLAVAGLATWLLTLWLAPLSAAERRERDVLIDRAAAAWAYGANALAQRELEQALAIDPRHAGARALSASLRGELSFTALQSAVSAEPTLSALFEVRAEQDAGRAHRAVEVARDALGRTRSSAVECALAAALLELKRTDEAVATARRAVELDGGSGAARATLARALFTSGAIADGVDAAVRAAPIFARAAPDGVLELPRMLARASAGAEVRAILRDRLERSPEDSLLWFALAYSLDSDHRLAEAAEAYERTAALDPANLRARLNLAHLYAGAQLGACAQCDVAFAETPELPAPAEAVAVLESILTDDRGSSAFALSRLVQTALDLQSRAPDARPLERIGARIAELLAAPALEPDARARLDEARQTLLRAAAR